MPDAGNTLLRHFDPEVQAAYARLQTRPTPEDADSVILAVVADHHPADPSDSQETPDLSNDELRLVADLGFDSVAIAEMVFFIEDLFEVQITNQEIMAIETLGELRLFVRTKLPAFPS